MGGPLRMVASDFSLGELSPELAGRVDSAAFHKGVEEMTNAEPYGLGGFHRSPGTMYVGNPHGNLEAFLVPWMVTADLSLIIEFTEGHIRLLGGDPSDKYTFMSPAQSGGADIDITDLDPTEVSSVPSYTLAHAKQIDWAQSNTEIVFTHKEYPIFFFRLRSDLGVDQTTKIRSLLIEYGISPLSGTIVSFVSWTKFWDTNDIYSSMASWMNNLVSYSMTGIVNGRKVRSGIVTDGVLKLMSSDTATVSLVSGSNTFVIPSGSMLLNQHFVGASVSGTGIPANTSILSVNQVANSVVISNNASQTVSSEITVYGYETIEKGATGETPSNLEMTLYPCSVKDEYPGSVAFFNNRLVVGGSKLEPNTIYASRPGSHFDLSLVETLAYDVTVPKEPPTPGVYTYVVRFTTSGTMKYVGAITAGAPAWSSSMIGWKMSDLKKVDGTYVDWMNSDNKISSIDASKASFSKSFGSSIWGKYTSYEGYDTSGSWTPPVYVPKAAEAYMKANNMHITFTEALSVSAPEYITKEETTQQIGSDNAMKIVLNTSENESIMWMETQGDLIIGTKTSEWIVSAQSDPTNMVARVVSRHGSARQKPCKLGGSLIYIQESRRIVKEFGDTGSRTVNELSNHLFVGDGKDIVDFDYTQSPEEAMYFVLSGGEMVKCLLNATAQTIAWTVRKPRTGDKYESVAVLASPHGDLVYCSVYRSSVNKRFIEVIAMNDDTGVLGQCYSGSCVYGSDVGTTKAGLYNLASQAVLVRGIKTGSSPTEYVNAHGTVAANGVLSFLDEDNVSISLSSYMIGLPEPMRVVLQRLDTIDTEGLVKTLTQVFMRLHKSSTFSLRYKDEPAVPADPNVPDYPASEIDCGTAVAYSGIYRTSFGGPWDDDQRIIAECATAGPVGVLSVISDLNIGTGG